MKRLLDETPDEFSRSLLQAGQGVHPDGVGKAKLLSTVTTGTLGAVGAYQLSKLPWWKAFLVTNVGKITAASLAISAGTTALVVVRGQDGEQASRAMPVATVPASASTEAPPLAAPSAPELGAAGGLAGEDPAIEDPAGEDDVEAVPGQHALAPLPPAGEAEAASAVAVRVPSGGSRAKSMRTKRSAVAGSAVSQRSADSQRSAVSQRSADSEPAAPAQPVSSPGQSVSGPAIAAQPSDLLREARLVNQLRQAVRDENRALAQRITADYWHQFPRGQLGPEVRKLESSWRRQTGD